MTVTPADIVRIARGWIGTPWHHQASMRGVGADCVGLVLGVYREAGFSTRGIGRMTHSLWPTGEEMLSVLLRHTERAPVAQDGDIIVMRSGSVARHIGIGVGETAVIHAITGRKVLETPLRPSIVVARLRVPEGKWPQ